MRLTQYISVANSRIIVQRVAYFVHICMILQLYEPKLYHRKCPLYCMNYDGICKAGVLTARTSERMIVYNRHGAGSRNLDPGSSKTHHGPGSLGSSSS